MQCHLFLSQFISSYQLMNILAQFPLPLGWYGAQIKYSLDELLFLLLLTHLQSSDWFFKPMKYSKFASLDSFVQKAPLFDTFNRSKVFPCHIAQASAVFPTNSYRLNCFMKCVIRTAEDKRATSKEKKTKQNYRDKLTLKFLSWHL